MARTTSARKQSAEVIRARKLAKVEAAWGSGLRAKREWTRWARCVLCGHKFCVNNNEKHRVETEFKTLGRWVCPWCLGRNGKQHLQRMILVERWVKGPQRICPSYEEETCKCPYHIARRLFGDHVADR